MTTATDTDVTILDDVELDAILMYLYAEHRVGDNARKVEVHAAIMAVIAEQTRRHDLWLQEHQP